VTTPHIKQLERLTARATLTNRVTIPRLLDRQGQRVAVQALYAARARGRTDLVQVGGMRTRITRRRAIALRLLWPKRQEQRSPFWRPDWRMSMAPKLCPPLDGGLKAVQEGPT